MLGLLRPKPPLRAWEKAWVETRMHWLAQQFGIQGLLEAEVILPNDEHFPGDYRGSEEDVRRYLDLLSGYLRTDVADLHFQVCEDCRCTPGAPRDDDGGRSVIQIPQSSLTDPQLLVATLAQHAAHERLRRHGVLDQLPDAPWVAELLTVFVGLGIFTTNCMGRGASVSPAKCSSTDMSQTSTLPTRMLGYALALFVWMREEPSPRWSKYLRQDGASMLRKSLTFLRRTADSLFQHSTLHLQRTAMSVNELIADLEGGSDSVRIAALWTLTERGHQGQAASAAVNSCLRAKDPSVRAEAAVTLSAFGGHADDETLEALFECLSDVKPEVRASAARTLGVVGRESQQAVLELSATLRDESPRVVGAAAMAVSKYGAEAGVALQDVLAALRTSLVQCHSENAALLAATLRGIVPDAERQVERVFDEYDAELRQIALDILAEQPGEKAGDSFVS